MHSVSGECFVFELTLDQARQLEIQDNILVRITGHEREERGLPPPQLVSLEALGIKHSAVVRQSHPITRCEDKCAKQQLDLVAPPRQADPRTVAGLV